MRKLTAVMVAVGLFCFGQEAIAGQTGPHGHITVTSPTFQNVEHANELMSRLSKIPTRAAEAKAEHSPGEFAAKAEPVVEQSPRYQNAHAPTQSIPQGVTETAKNLQSNALAAEGAMQSKEADSQAEKASVAQ